MNVFSRLYRVEDAGSPLDELVESLLDDTITPDDHGRLEKHLAGDLAARRHFIEFARLHAAIRWDFNDLFPPDVAHEPQPLLDRQPPFLGFLTTTYHGTLSFFSQEVPFAILMATLFMGLGGLLGSLMTVEHYTQMPGQSQPSADRSFASNASADKTIQSEEEVIWVGRITGMVDCKWSDDKNYLPPGGDYVALGRKYKLDSGLMEIAYDTGAKVILQGPVTYEVESVNGGYISVGKLTGKVEEAKAKGFFVRTPTAIVTDLGTEFGVEVGKDGYTESQVLRGSVAIRLVAADGSSIGEESILHMNDSARVEKPSDPNNRQTLVIHHNVADPKKFVCDMPKRKPPMQVLAYFCLGEDDPGAAAGAPANERTIDHGGTAHLEKHGSPSYAAAAVPGSSLAMNFTGAEGEYFFAGNLGWTPDDNFILEAWVRPNRVVDGQSCIVHNGQPGTEVNNPSILDGYGLFVYDRHYEYLFGGVNWSPPLAPCEPGKWTHLALVCQQRKVQFWLNGRLVHEANNLMWPLPSSGQFMIGGVPAGISTMPRSFDGQIDEVRLSIFQGPFQPAMLLLLEKTKPQPRQETGGGKGQ